jgi:hypothetical protein
MGHQLTREALSVAYWHACEHDPLTNGERWVLVVMAHHALDKPGKTMPARIYAMGWRVLGWEGLGRPVWNASVKREVARAISGLTKRGLIREADDQDNRHKRYVVLPPGGGLRDHRGGGPSDHP